MVNRTTIILLIVVTVAIAYAMFVLIKKKMKKTVAAAPVVQKLVDANGESTTSSDILKSLPSVPIANDELFLMPNSSIGTSTRDGRVKNIDIRGTPAVTVSEDGPIWNLGSNRLPAQTLGTFNQ